MSVADTIHEAAPDRRLPTDRRNAILDAFERCIVRAGFHRTTMQDVAREAGTSAGNLYRYFVSKDQLVSGLCERDRERFGSEVEAIIQSPDVISAFIAVGRRHLVDEPHSRCVQLVEIWAEATRNPAVASVCKAIDDEVGERFVRVIEAAKRVGQVAPQVDAVAAMAVLSAMADGFHMRRALDPDFDPEEGFHLLVTVMRQLFAGTIDLSPAPAAATAPASS